MKTIHCREPGCGKAIRGESFPERMAKLRRHRKKHHPTAHKRSVKKAQETREKRARMTPAQRAWITRKKKYGRSGRR